MKLYNIGYMTDINLKQEYELVPLDDLLEGVVVSAIACKCVGEDQTSKRVASLWRWSVECAIC